ncbi:MAG: pimeloyl-ACP methyl ester carboxylesterase [Actinomycetes bacterium]|jgi:pimeloyl-ACP methyl ester carboxylesterase
MWDMPMPIAVPIVAGTAIKGVTASVMMRGVMERHPNTFIVTLSSFGLTVPLHRSQSQIARDVQRGLAEQGRDPDSPLVMVGHSQGALGALRYALDHQDQVLHVFSVGCPWQGSVSAGFWSNRLNRRNGRDLAPALRDMTPNSDFLTELHADLPAIANRVTNIYSTHELFIRPYVAAHIDIEGVTNVLISNEAEYGRHLRTFQDLAIDELIEVNGRVTHVGEMNTPEVRSLVWRKVEELSADIRLGRKTPNRPAATSPPRQRQASRPQPQSRVARVTKSPA